ncbi:MAG: cytochrome P450 [Deltaproteobacteria bacterium]|nr:MAG: cytochrome P450 [Deltaproteobacteria bacterium]
MPASRPPSIASPPAFSRFLGACPSLHSRARSRRASSCSASSTAPSTNTSATPARTCCIGPTLLDGGIYPDPGRFDPDRWLHATDRQQKAWIPHGGGIHGEGHRCAGEALATLMLKVFAVRMLRRFDWSVENQDLSPTKGKIFATPASGLQVELKSM